MAKLCAAVIGVFIFAFPKSGVFVGGGVPLYSSIVAGALVSAAGWLLALQRLHRRREGIAILMISLTLVIWFGNFIHYALAYSLAPFDVARMGFMALSMAALGSAFLMTGRPEIAAATATAVKLATFFLLAYACLQVAFGAEAVAVRRVTALYEDTFREVIYKHNIVYSVDSSVFKIFSTYQNGNLFSVCLVLMAPIAVHLVGNFYRKVAVLAVFNVVVLFSASLSAYLGCIVVNLVFFVTSARRHWSALPVLLVAPPVLLLAYLQFVCRGMECLAMQLVQSRLLGRDVLENPRWRKISEALDQLGEHPWNLLLGDMHGSGSYIYEVFVPSVVQHFGLASATLLVVSMLMLLRPLKFRFYKAGFYAYFLSSWGEGGFWLSPTPFVIAICLGLVAHLDELDQRSPASAA